MSIPTDLTKYINNATRTESVVPEIVLNKELLLTVLRLHIHSGHILDKLKKLAFYGKEYIPSQLDRDIQECRNETFNLQYGIFAHRENIAVNSRLFHGILGIATESTELCENLLNQIENNIVDNTNIIEELGDVNWYQAILIDETKADFVNILETNINKLKARYPDKFTEVNANNRDLNKEREILENSNKPKEE